MTRKNIEIYGTTPAWTSLMIDAYASLCFYVFMRTTLDLPDDLFREAKTRAVLQGTTLKQLMTEYIQSGLSGKQATAKSGTIRRSSPPVAIRRAAGSSPTPARSNRELNALLEEDEVVRASRISTQASRDPS